MRWAEKGSSNPILRRCIIYSQQSRKSHAASQESKHVSPGRRDDCTSYRLASIAVDRLAVWNSSHLRLAYAMAMIPFMGILASLRIAIGSCSWFDLGTGSRPAGSILLGRENPPASGQNSQPRCCSAHWLAADIWNRVLQPSTKSSQAPPLVTLRWLSQ